MIIWCLQFCHLHKLGQLVEPCRKYLGNHHYFLIRMKSLLKNYLIISFSSVAFIWPNIHMLSCSGAWNLADWGLDAYKWLSSVYALVLLCWCYMNALRLDILVQPKTLMQGGKVSRRWSLLFSSSILVVLFTMPFSWCRCDGYYWKWCNQWSGKCD